MDKDGFKIIFIVESLIAVLGTGGQKVWKIWTNMDKKPNRINSFAVADVLDDRLIWVDVHTYI